MAEKYGLTVCYFNPPWLATKPMKYTACSSITGNGGIPDWKEKFVYFLLPAMYIHWVEETRSACSSHWIVGPTKLMPWYIADHWAHQEFFLLLHYTADPPSFGEWVTISGTACKKQAGESHCLTMHWLLVAPDMQCFDMNMKCAIKENRLYAMFCFAQAQQWCRYYLKANVNWGQYISICWNIVH